MSSQQALRRATEIRKKFPVTLGLVGHWKADSIVGVSTNTQFNQWDDSSAVAGHATQADVNKRPTYIENVRKGLPVVRFGTGKYFSTPMSSNHKPCTFFLAFKRLTPGVGAIPLGPSTTAFGHILSISGPTGKFTPGQFGQVDFAAANTVLAISQWYVIVYTYSSAGVASYYLNEVADGGGTDNRTFTGSTTMIGSANDGEYTSNIDLGEIGKYDRVISAEERAVLTAYLMQRWI